VLLILIVLIQRPNGLGFSDSQTFLRSKLLKIMSNRQRRLKHQDEYDQAYRLAREEQLENLPFSEKPYQLTAEYGPGVKCNITVLFMDPRLSTLPPGRPAWFALESVATFTADACVLIQTCE
jgi:hypothetical protein